MTERPKNIRPATVGDEDKLYDLLCMAWRENAPYQISQKKVCMMIDAATHDKEVIVGVIDTPDGTGLSGSIGGFFSQWWYTEDFHIEECWNFVHPEHRKSTHARDLINYMKWVSENMDMPLHMGILTATKLEEKVRLYRRQMPQVGAAFAYNMESGKGPIAGDLNG